MLQFAQPPFLILYNCNDNNCSLIGLDDAMWRLGVLQRWIYNIVNVLESVRLLARKFKNTYTWKGFGAIPKALKDIKEEKLYLTQIPTCNNNPVMRPKEKSSTTSYAKFCEAVCLLWISSIIEIDLA